MEESVQPIQDVVWAKGKNCVLLIAGSMLDRLQHDHQLEFLRDESRSDSFKCREETLLTNKKIIGFIASGDMSWRHYFHCSGTGLEWSSR